MPRTATDVRSWSVEGVWFTRVPDREPPERQTRDQSRATQPAPRSAPLASTPLSLALSGVPQIPDVLEYRLRASTNWVSALLLATFLYVSLDEFFGVLLKDVVDFVE